MKKIILGLLAALFVLLIGIAIISYWILTKPLPEYEGSENVKSISSNIKIYRDSSAVPYIIAAKETDAAFALGYVHAQERMFQMDITRRAGEGRLAEILGSRAAPFDKMFRTIGIYEISEKIYPELNPRSKELLDAYADGVNEYLRLNNDNYSVEFDVLGYTPYKWKPEHSISIAKLMAWELNISLWTDVAFSHLVQKIGAEKAAEILPQFPENTPVIIPDHLEKISMIGTGLVETDKQFRKFFGIEGTHIGSNNWVINSKRSQSGKPIIANDPHLAFSIPGKWYVAVIRAGEWNAEGFTIPGLPGIVIGKNENISWVLTNVMADDADFYVEKLDTSGTKYFMDNAWNSLTIKKDTIVVKDSSDIIYDIRKTHRGPIISEIHPYNVLFPDSSRSTADISMNWTALNVSDELYAIYSVNTAGNWTEFKEALRYFTAPGQNFVYADKEDNIGYVCAVKLPIRSNNSPTLIFDGTSSGSDWQGFVDYNEMPKLFNPDNNYIASANNKTVKSFPYHISNIWEPPSRIDRIVELLGSKEKHSVKDFKKYQMDFYSHYAKIITPYILDAFKNTKINDPNLNLSLELLKNWNFVMDKYDQAPTIFLVFFQNLLENIFIDEMGESLFKEYIFIANVPYRIVEQMFRENNSIWFDNVKTETYETRDVIIRESLSGTLSELEEKFGGDIAQWQWLNLHTLTFMHPFSGVSPIVDKIVNVGPFTIGGDGTTIFNTEYSFTDPYKNKLGPSMRYIFDFSKPDEFEFILPTGQSGHIMSDHYSDMTSKWLEGKYIKLKTDNESIVSPNNHLLLLVPGDNQNL